MKQAGSEGSGRIEQKCAIGGDSKHSRSGLSGGTQDSQGSIRGYGWIDFLHAEIRSRAIAETVGRERFQPMHHAMSRQDNQARAIHINEGHHYEFVGSEFGRSERGSLAGSAFIAIVHGGLVAVMTVGDNQVFVAHLAADEFDEAGIRDFSQLMQNSIFVTDFYIVFRIRCGAARQGFVDLGSRIAVEHEKLAEMRPGGAQQLQTVRLRFG